MPITVVTWGTGNVGKYAVRAVLNHPELKLIGHIVSGETKTGKDVAELVGLDEPAVHLGFAAAGGGSVAALRHPGPIGTDPDLARGTGRGDARVGVVDPRRVLPGSRRSLRPDLPGHRS